MPITYHQLLDADRVMSSLFPNGTRPVYIHRYTEVYVYRYNTRSTKVSTGSRAVGSVVAVSPHPLCTPAREDGDEHHDDDPEVATEDVVRGRECKEGARLESQQGSKRVARDTDLTIVGENTLANACANSANPFDVPSEDVPGV